ncbi:ESX secretion-associated protein EspG [Amycolatopsis sp. H20-H5]|uniref:ESX secretion-associated protein EspG n=1 Tax=Amycolatopsis sp. H20-H5 TaxID=3046309 RepID=UPI002DB883BD|nr:ESX secretion-associated protein EspG [Amycolatopsis sp. H20-H5]MEC3980718.1 ESX secretion-associated protein EspG [Amycolatopsis sp. H20-H5]
MADRFEFVLSSVEAVIVGQALGSDVRQYPLRFGNITVDPARFLQVAKHVHAALEERRLSADGDLHPGIRTAFGLLGAHRVAVAVNGVDGLGGDIAVLTLTDGAQALGITQAPGEDDLQFSLFADEDLVDVVAGVLPPARAATTGEHTVRRQATHAVSAMTARRRAEADADEEETDAFGNIELKGVVRPAPRERSRSWRPPAPGGADVMERVLAAPRLGGGHLTVTGWSRRGERLVAPPIGWLDTEDGRYLVRTTTGESGELSADYIPAARGEVAAAVHRAIATIY